LGINRGIGKDEGQGLISGGRRDSHVMEVVLRVIMVVVMVGVKVKEPEKNDVMWRTS